MLSCSVGPGITLQSSNIYPVLPVELIMGRFTVPAFWFFYFLLFIGILRCLLAFVPHCLLPILLFGCSIRVCGLSSQASWTPEDFGSMKGLTPNCPKTQHLNLVVSRPGRTSIFGGIGYLDCEICFVWIYSFFYETTWIDFLIWLVTVFILVLVVRSKYSKACVEVF